MSKSFLTVEARFRLALNFLAQMNLQFVQRHGGLDPGGEHLPPPFSNGVFEVEHFLSRS